MSNTQIQAVQDEITVVGSYTQKHLDTIKSTIAKGTSNEQFALFMQTCVRTGLDPFLNQIYCIVYNGKDGPVMSMQIAVEGIVSLAKAHPQYKGFIASEVRENDHFKANVATGEVEHEPNMMSPGKTMGAYCIAYREGMPNILVVIRSDQVEHLLKGRNGQMWKDYFDDMIVKHAIKRAFKRQYGIEVSEDEVVNSGPSVDNLPNYERKDITPSTADPEVINPGGKQQSGAPNEEDRLKQARAEMKKKFTQLGITDKSAMADHMNEFCKMKGDVPTLQELTGYLKLMDIHIAEKQAAQAQDDDLPE
jgi:recombination protein RecT